MDTKRICPGCQKPLPSEAPDGLCPACLIRAGAGTGVDLGADSQTERGRTPFVAPAVEEVARLFPQLEILSFLGQGGMGAVYRARQKALDRVVALKILPPDIGKEPAFAERFTREAKALARLNHPGVVTLYEFGQADGLFFFLMEFVDGVSLRHLLEVERLSAREALAIVPQICDALQYAHDQGIVHRDIKPENILLDRLGRVKVADFGLAKLVGTEALSPALSHPMAEGGLSAPGAATPPPAALTDAGKVMGTPQYMAPEQREHPTDVDHRADIYSLGVVFYQMLTGELPGKPIEPPSHKIHIDVRLDEIVLRALEKEPARRYQQASALKTQVETILTTPPAPPAGPSAPPSDNGEPRELQPPRFSRAVNKPPAGPPVPSSAQGRPASDWITWSPLQSPRDRTICAHMTNAEQREGAKRAILFGIWNAMTFFGPWFCFMFLPPPLHWIFGTVVLLVGLSFYPLWRRMQRDFLDSTAWARQQDHASDRINDAASTPAERPATRPMNFWMVILLPSLALIGLAVLLAVRLLANRAAIPATPLATPRVELDVPAPAPTAPTSSLPARAAPAITRVVVSRDQATITGCSPDAGMSLIIGGHANNDVWVSPHNGSPFTVTLTLTDLGLRSGGQIWFGWVL